MLYAQGLEVHTKCIVDWETHEQLLTNTSICQSNQPKPLDDIEFIPLLVQKKIHMGVSLHSTKNKRFNARLSSKEKLKFKEGNWLILFVELELTLICGKK